ncbi:hypothetical protein ACFT38_28085 [Streptomyces sp. NPDC056975]|uniref:hypothetical protein n=1 Tax=Streptomyces sp. NPDC056975 TaxID=3345985 RepID=UPI00363CB53D
MRGRIQPSPDTVMYDPDPAVAHRLAALITRHHVQTSHGHPEDCASIHDCRPAAS